MRKQSAFYDQSTASIVIDSITPGTIADYTFILIGTGLASNNGIIEGVRVYIAALKMLSLYRHR